MSRSHICCKRGRRALLVIGLSGLTLALAQLVGAGAARPQPPSPSDYLVGPQDVLQITVFEEPSLSDVFTVDNDGTITVPLISRVAVENLTVREIQEEITRRLLDGFLRNPLVDVEIARYRSQSVYVLGEVVSPGIYQLSGALSLLDALVQAGGTTPQAGNEVQIIRSTRDGVLVGPLSPEDRDPEVDVTVVDLQDILTGRLALVTLRAGDTVYVPKVPIFYVLGRVSAPGSYVWTQDMTVRQAVALAGGYTDRGSNRGIRVTRVVDGESTSVGVREDDLVQPGDTITIRARRF